MSQDKPSSPNISGAKFVFSIVVASYNQDLVEALLQKTIATLTQAQVAPQNIRVLRVPGSGELPYIANMTASSSEFDCVIVLGVVIAGDTPHHEIIGQSTAIALQEVAIRTEVPVINGIVVTNNRAQAEQRCIGSLDRGTEFAQAALVMAQHRQTLGERLDTLEDLDEPFAKN